MALFSYKAAKHLSLLCASFTFLSLAPSNHPAQDAQFLKRMKAYWKEGDFETAKRQIRSYLERTENSDLKEELHLLLGDLYLKDGNFSSSLEEYEQITKKELQEKVFYNKALCLYEMQKIQDLADISDSFSSLSSLTVEQKNSVRYLCASSLFNYLTSSEEKDPAVVQRALELFENCKETPFESLSYYPLAKLHEITGNKKQAAFFYEASAQLSPEKAPDFLFQAAFLQSESDPDLAVQNFLKILSYSSNKKSEALYNCLLLQYKTNQFENLITTYKEKRNLLEEKQAPLATYLFGKSLYQLNQFEQAIEPLISSLDPSLPVSSRKTAQLMALKCAQKTNNIELYQKIFRNPSYPLVNDASYATAHLVYLELLKASEKYPEFIEESKMFVLQNPEHAEREKILWDTAYFLYQTKKWEESDLLLSQFVTKYPSSQSEDKAWRLKLNISLAQLQTSSEEMLHTHREQFIEKLQIALQKPDVFSSLEKEHFSFELIKNLFLEEKFPETLQALTLFVQSSPTSSFSNDLQLIQTLCYLSDPATSSLFIEHATKLLQDQPEIAQADKIRLHLFNTYVELTQNSPLEEKQELLNQAADHLYCIFQKQKTPLQPENLEWLAQHYYLLSKNMQIDSNAPQNLKETYQAKSIQLLEQLLTKENSLDQSSEIQLFKLSELFTWSNQPEKKLAVLERFLQANSSSSSAIQRQLSLELAQTYEVLGYFTKALDLYALLIQKFPESQIKALAILDRSKLLLTCLSDEQKTEDNVLYVQNLNDLKDLEMQKSLESEPLHLEAGLEYIRWKALLTKETSSQQEKTLLLLRLFKENFQSESLAATEEISTDLLLEEKQQTLQFYLKFAEAEILRLEACLMENQVNAKVLTQEAATKIEELLNLSSLPKQLKQRVQTSQQELSKSL